MNMLHKYNKIIFIAVAMLCFFVAPHAKAANVGDYVSFNVDPNYDASARSKVSATLVKTTSSIYFYVETSWWDAQIPDGKNKILNNFDALSSEFSSKIYPTLTSTYGSEWNPGIDSDSKITILFESVNNNLGGYFRSSDEYSKLQIPVSNEREMLYMPIDQIDNSQLKVFLAHEFVHLIVFNQKDRLQGVPEEVWLSEARSDYASTILGYDDTYEGSNLQRRVQDFLNQPSDSLTEWQGTKYDYAVESLFMHYLVDHYTIHILTDSLKSKLVGIPSINEALLKNGAKEDFAKIFTNWTIGLTINSCAQDPNYCYTNTNLTNLKINPTLIFLPLTGNSSLSMNNTTKNWSANWQKIIGGNGDLKLQFSSLAGLNFKLPYIIYDKNNNYVIKFLQLDSQSKGEIDIKDFGNSYNSLVVIPSLQSKLSGFDGAEVSYPYTFTVSITGTTPQDDPVVIQKLLDQIALLKAQIAKALANNGGGTTSNAVCLALNTNLYFGVFNSASVSCLQQFLKSQGVQIYPQGFVTGAFGSLTKAAVIRFQKKYNLPQTGFVGIITRTKINTLLNGG